MDDRLREAPADLSAIEQAAMAQWGDTAQNHNRARRILAALSASPPLMGAQPFQERVAPWMQACFGPEISADKEERGDRLVEEVFELLQSGGYDPARIAPLRDYTWSRAIGEPKQEAGGVMVTLAAYCLAHGLDMHDAGEAELARIWTKVDQIRAKQAAKPTGSALPAAAAAADTSAERGWQGDELVWMLCPICGGHDDDRQMMCEACGGAGMLGSLEPDRPQPTTRCWRAEVVAFADLMEAQLYANDHKPGWKGENPWPLLSRLREETDELAGELQPGSRTNAEAWRHRLGAEAADVANFAMMIADVCGALSFADTHPLPTTASAVEEIPEGEGVAGGPE